MARPNVPALEDSPGHAVFGAEAFHCGAPLASGPFITEQMEVDAS